jgi:hypothetical protein
MSTGVGEVHSVERPIYITDAGETVGLTPKKAKKMKLMYKARRTLS